MTSESALIDGRRRGSANLCRDVDCGMAEGSGVADGGDCSTVGSSDVADGTHLDIVEVGTNLHIGDGVRATLSEDQIALINKHCGIEVDFINHQGKEEEKLKEDPPKQKHNNGALGVRTKPC